MKIKIAVTRTAAKQSALCAQGIDGQALFKKKSTAVHNSTRKPSRSRAKQIARKDLSNAF